MVFWERRVGLLLVLAAVGVGVYGAVSVPGWPWSFPVACALAFVGSVGLTSPRPSARLLAQYERWRAYEGTRCGLCGEPIHEDDLSTYVDDELCHQGCAEVEYDSE